MTKQEIIEQANHIQIALSDDESDVLHQQINDVLNYIALIESYDCDNEQELNFMVDDTNRSERTLQWGRFHYKRR